MHDVHCTTLYNIINLSQSDCVGQILKLTGCYIIIIRYYADDGIFYFTFFFCRVVGYFNTYRGGDGEIIMSFRTRSGSVKLGDIVLHIILVFHRNKYTPRHNVKKMVTADENKNHTHKASRITGRLVSGVIRFTVEVRLGSWNLAKCEPGKCLFCF